MSDRQIGSPPDNGVSGLRVQIQSDDLSQRAMEEILSWLVARLLRRAKESRREKDRSHLGQRTILNWLETDKYTYEQKFHTLTSICPGAGDLNDYVAVGDQLRRLLLRCRRILSEGFDIDEKQQFTCPLPLMQDEASITASKRSFKLLLETHRVTNPPMQQRFEMVGDAILGVAKWIKNLEFAVKID